MAPGGQVLDIMGLRYFVLESVRPPRRLAEQEGVRTPSLCLAVSHLTRRTCVEQVYTPFKWAADPAQIRVWNSKVYGADCTMFEAIVDNPAPFHIM